MRFSMNPMKMNVRKSPGIVQEKP